MNDVANGSGREHGSASDADARALSLRPLMFERVACSMAMTSFVALAGPIGRVLGLAPWQIGTAITVAGIAWMVCAPMWGRASDRRGRRSVVLTGLIGFSLSYGALCLFIEAALRIGFTTLTAFAGLVVLRGLAGAFYTAVPPTSAALIADHVPPERRAGAMAMLGAAGGAGMAIGPAFAGVLAPFGLGLPLYAIAPLPAIALVVLWHTLPRGEHGASRPKPAPRLADARLRRPMAVGFVSMFSVSIAQIIVGFYSIDRLGLEPTIGASVAGVALACVGVGLSLSQLLVRKLGWAPARLIRIGGLTAAVGFGAVVFADSPPLLFACYFVAAGGMGWVWPSVSALAANSVERHEQGAAAGAVAAALGFGTIVGPLAGTVVYDFGLVVPYMMIAVMLAVTAVWPQRLVPLSDRGTE